LHVVDETVKNNEKNGLYVRIKKKKATDNEGKM